MNELEFIQSLLDIVRTGGPIGSLAVAYLIYDKISKMQKNIETLNHNSTVITRVLLKKRILKPDDIKDVSL